MLSGYDTFNKMEGYNGGISFKSMWSPRGWYYKVNASLDYFRVWYDYNTYFDYTDSDGIRKYEWAESEGDTKFYKPSLTFDIGKHFALGRRLFLDGFIGLGYAWNFHEGALSYNDNPYTFGGDGFYFNWGFRIGVLLGK